MGDLRINRKKYRNEMPVVEDGWWESVLADELKYMSQSTKSVNIEPAVEDKTTETSETEPVHIDWDAVRQFYKNDRIIEMKVMGHNRGGLLVEGEGLSGFVPLSHLIDLTGEVETDDHSHSLVEYQGKSVKVKVIECAPEENRIIFSERAALSEPGKRVELFHQLAPGAQVTGTVTNITDFGVFVDLGGVEGLIHISELSWGRVTHPGQLVKISEELKVQVLDISAERCRVALSLKRLLPNPWDKAVNDFPEGSLVNATITNVLSYGAFAQLEVGVEGLIHASEMRLEDGKSPRDILLPGQVVQLRVLHLDPKHQRLGFSMLLDQK
jgi:small subunit ribosomal protein S1